MNRRDFVRTTLAAGAALPFAQRLPGAAAKQNRPNVLILMSDQHQAGVASFAGRPDLHTPHLDRLAAEGVRYDRAYCQDGICSPSRHALMTSQYPRTFGIYGNDMAPRVMADMVPMQRVFRAMGYQTFTAGKRHLSRPVDTDWDFAFGHLPEEADRDTENYWTWIRRQGLLAEMTSDWNAEFGYTLPLNLAAAMACRISSLPPSATMEAFTTEKTIEFLRSGRNSDKPFFAWSTFYRPHQPYTPLKRYADQFDPASVRLPANLFQPREQLPPLLSAIRNQENKPWALADATRTPALYNTYVAYYLALVKEIDDHIGRILDELDRQGLAENTIVIYTADHGDFVAGHGMIEKAASGHNVYEETLRVPLIVRLPDATASGKIRADLVELVDLYPTLVELCDLAIPKGYRLAGRSLVDNLRRGAPVGRRFVVSENWSQATVITDRHKLGRWLNCPIRGSDYRSFGDMVFSREADPGENQNLRGTASGTEISRILERHLTDWVNSTDDRGRREAVTRLGMPYTVM